MRIAKMMLIGLVAVGLMAAACGDDDDDDSSEPTNTSEASATDEPSATDTAEPDAATATSEPTTGGGSSELTITAENVQFSTSQLTMAAGVETTITMTNNDDGIPHNLRVVAGSVNEAIEPPFTNADGPMVLTLTIDTPGTYEFRCDIHPATMVGTVVVE